MARIRSIKPDFFTDGEIGELGFAARLFFIGLWCHADREGRLEDKPKQLAARIIPYDHERGVDGEVLLSELSPKFITRYEVGGQKLLQIRNFARHQLPHYKEAASTLPPPSEKDTVKLHNNNNNNPILTQHQPNIKSTSANVDSTLPSVIRSCNRSRKGREGKGKEQAVAEVRESVDKSTDSFHVYMDWFLHDTLGLEPGVDDQNKRAAVSAAYQRFGRAGKQIMAFAGGDAECAKAGTIAVGRWLQSRGLTWHLDTVAKWFSDWKRDPSNFGLSDKSYRRQ